MEGSSEKSSLYVQMEEAYGRVLYTQTTHDKQYLRLEKQNRRIKLAQIIVSAISTGGILGSAVTENIVTTWIGGIFSTVLLIINLYYKDFNLGSMMSSHRKASDELWLIREQYISLLTDFEAQEESESRKKRDELQIRTHEIYKNAPKTDGKSYSIAQKALKTEEEQFFSSDELNKLLPIHLRTKE